jgi:hypothetical protein
MGHWVMYANRSNQHKEPIRLGKNLTRTIRPCRTMLKHAMPMLLTKETEIREMVQVGRRGGPTIDVSVSMDSWVSSLTTFIRKVSPCRPRCQQLGSRAVLGRTLNPLMTGPGNTPSARTALWRPRQLQGEMIDIRSSLTFSRHHQA